MIRDWPAPKTVKDVKSFLQTVQFNAVYMAAEKEGEINYPELTAPLRSLTRRKVIPAELQPVVVQLAHESRWGCSGRATGSLTCPTWS